MRTAAVVLLIVMCGYVGAESFRDVPKDHWAAEAVRNVADAGIMKGYPNGTFKGEKPVTRFELAVALESFVELIQQSRKPIEVKKKSEKPQPQPHWGKDAMAFLKAGRFLPPDSKLLKDGAKPVTSDDLADALASVAKRLIELDVPAEGPHQD